MSGEHVTSHCRGPPFRGVHEADVLPIPGAVRVTDRGGLTGSAMLALDVRPASPSKEIGISINNGAVATNNPRVTLTLAWPRLTATALISNDGGFGAAGMTTQVPIGQTVPWTIASHAGRFSRTVYVRFRGAGGDMQTLSDDIILDESSPEIASATLESATRHAARAAAARVKQRKYKIAVSARDKQSGIVWIEVAARKNTAGKIVSIKRSAKVKKTISFTASAATAYVRVEDAGGNFSTWRKAQRRATAKRS